MIQTKRNRQTGTRITIGRAEELAVDTDAGPWATICEDHSIIMNHRTRTLAGAHAADPAGWCESCREVLERRWEALR